MLVGGGTWCGGAVARAVTVSVLRVTWCLKLLHVRRRNCRLGTYNCDMGSIHLGAIALLSESEGVFTTAQAERMGVPRDALHDAVESGRLERIMRGAYRMIGSGSLYGRARCRVETHRTSEFAHEPAEVGDQTDRPHGRAEAVGAMASWFWRARTTVAHTAWTTMRMIARATVTACAGFAEAEAPRAIVDMTTVPAVSRGRPWFAGAARAIPPTRRRPRRPRAPATRCSCPRRGTRRPGG